jgi:hypothetical protein
MAEFALAVTPFGALWRRNLNARNTGKHDGLIRLS